MHLLIGRWSWRGFALLAGLISAPGLAADSIPAADFARDARYTSVRLSPTGEYLAVTTPLEDQTALGFIDLKSGKPTGGLRFTKGEHVFDVRWVGPRRIVSSIATLEGPLDQPRRTGELFAVDVDGRNAAYLYGYRGGEQVGTLIQRVGKEFAEARVVDVLRGDPDHALISILPWGRRDTVTPSLERIHVGNGRRKRVASLPVYAPAQIAADRAGVPRLASGRDRDLGARLVAWDERSGDWKGVPVSGAGLGDITVHGVRGDGQSAFYSIESAAGDCLQEYEFGAAANREVHCLPPGGTGQVAWAADRSEPVAILSSDPGSAIVLLRPQHPDAQVLTLLEKSFKGERVVVSSWTDDGSRMVFFAHSDRNPGSYYLYDRTTRKAEHLFAERPWIDPQRMQPVEPISYPARDGLLIHGYLTVAKGLKARQRPLVVMPHGGPHGIRDYWQWDAWAQFLASRGYAVLQPNYRGSGGYGSAFENAGHRKWGTLMQDDLTDAVHWAIAQKIADPARICIVGGSYGGYAAMMSAVREPDLYRCAVGFAGVYNLDSHADDSDIADSHFGRKFLAEVLGAEGKVLREHSPISYIEKLKAAVLIAHGTADRRVPFSQAKELRGALEKHGKPYEWLEFAGEEHGFHKLENHEKFLLALEAFLDKHIGTGAAAVSTRTD